jgi:large subunit ribosomal protein L17
MIHRRKGRKLKRTASHRKATLSNLSVSLIKNKKLRTTLAKARELRTFFESLITKSRKAYSLKDSRKEYSVHLRREVNKFLKDREAVKTLFDEIAPKVLERQGGYLRVLKMGRRLGDAAEVAIVELVDYNVEQAEQKGKEKESAEEVKKPKTKSKAKKTTTKKTSVKKTTSKKTSKPKKKEETAD